MSSTQLRTRRTRFRHLSVLFVLMAGWTVFSGCYPQLEDGGAKEVPDCKCDGVAIFTVKYEKALGVYRARRYADGIQAFQNLLSPGAREISQTIASTGLGNVTMD